MTIEDIQAKILQDIGVKTTVSKLTGSMKDYTRLKAKKGQQIPFRYNEKVKDWINGGIYSVFESNNTIDIHIKYLKP